jgi:tetratricopeptide (TPR) repeat protein
LQLTVAPGYLQSRATVKDADAYELMLRARHAADRGDKDGLDEAIVLFQRALVRDPMSADSAAGLAFTYQQQTQLGFPAPAAIIERARHAATTALSLDPKNARAHFVLGLIHLTYDWDWASSEQEFQQTATLAPGSADAPNGKSHLSITLGRWDDALEQVKAAIALDPLDPDNFLILSWIQVRRNHLREAEVAARRVLDIRPNWAWGHNNLGLVLLARGERDAALLEMQQETADDAKQQGLAMAYYALGRRAESDAVLATWLQEYANTEAFQIAEVYAFRGQPDEAMHWLERAYAQKDSGLFTVKGDPPLKSLEADSRFKAFLHKMKLPE